MYSGSWSKEITINIVPKHVEALTVKLKELGVDIQVDGDLKSNHQTQIIL